MSTSVVAPRCSSLLRLCIRLYLSSRERCYVNYLKGAKAVFKVWYLDVPFKVSDLERISQVFPSICMCGNRISNIGSTIVYHCDICNLYHWNLDYELNELVSITQVPLPILTALFSQELEYGYQTQAAQLFLPLSST